MNNSLYQNNKNVHHYLLQK